MKPTPISRSARTGKFVTKKKAVKNKRTTVTETVTGYERHKKDVLSFIEEVKDSCESSPSFSSAPYWLKKSTSLLKKIK